LYTLPLLTMDLRSLYVALRCCFFSPSFFFLHLLVQAARFPVYLMTFPPGSLPPPQGQGRCSFFLSVLERTLYVGTWRVSQLERSTFFPPPFPLTPPFPGVPCEERELHGVGRFGFSVFFFGGVLWGGFCFFWGGVCCGVCLGWVL